jgi:RNA 2',3'-cyclic 3'-phosphodiesterase
VALTPPDDVVEALHAYTRGLRESAPELRWTRPEHWHVTAAFLGEVSDDVVDELTRRLNRAAARHPPLALALGGGGRFGHQVLWTGVRGDRDGLRMLADSTRAAARRTGLVVEHRTYPSARHLGPGGRRGRPAATGRAAGVVARSAVGGNPAAAGAQPPWRGAGRVGAARADRRLAAGVSTGGSSVVSRIQATGTMRWRNPAD